MLDDQRCLTTLEPRLDLSMLLLTLMTTTRCLSVSGRGTTTNSFLHVNSTGGVGETGEDRRIAGLEGEAGEVRSQRRDGSVAGRSAAQRRAERGDSRRHRRRRGAVAASVEFDDGDLEVNG